jgi:hypothetical protein
MNIESPKTPYIAERKGLNVGVRKIGCKVKTPQPMAAAVAWGYIRDRSFQAK